MQCRSPLHDGATPGPSEKAKANSRFSSDTGVDCGEASIPPRGFTLIELATVVGILGLLLALVVPAAQSVREAARRSQCSAHMRQLGIAIHTYHDVYNVLPPGRIKSYDSRYFGPRPPCSSRIVDKSIFIFALQFIDNTNLYNCVNQDLAIIGAENSTIHVSATPIFTCPSDPKSGYPRDLVPSPLSEYGLPIRARMVFSS